MRPARRGRARFRWRWTAVWAAAPGPTAKADHRCARSARCSMRPSTPRPSGSGAAGPGPGLGGGAARMVQRLRAEGIRCEPVLQAIALVQRHRFVDSALANAGLRGHQPADRPGADDLQAFGGGAHAGAAVRGRVGARQRAPRPRARDRHRLRLPGRAAGASWRSRVVSIERLKPLHDKARSQPGRPARTATCAWSTATAASATPPRCALRQHHRRGRRRRPARGLAGAAGRGRPAGGTDATTRRAGSGQVLLVVDRQPQGLVRRSCTMRCTSFP